MTAAPGAQPAAPLGDGGAGAGSGDAPAARADGRDAADRDPGAIPAGSTGVRFARLDSAVFQGVRIVSAALVVVEVLILFAGVISRYVFRRPIPWSDEVATFLFLWLGMLGTAIAFRRNEHLRLTTVAAQLSPQWRRRLDTLTAFGVLGFVLLLIPPAVSHMIAQTLFTLPATDTPDSYRVLAVVVGLVLVAATAINRLLFEATLGQALTACIVLAGAPLLLWLAQPALQAIGNYSLVIFFVGLLGTLVLIGVPIAFSFGIATVAYLASTSSIPLTVVISQMEEGMSGLLLLAIPLFVFLGLLIEMAGIAAVLVRFLFSLVGHLRGGLACVLLLAMYLVSGISGSKAADMAAVAPALMPEMKRRGSEPGELAALLAASAAMSETIPPSLILIMLGAVAGVSIAALFTAGLLPAAVCALALLVLAVIRAPAPDKTIRRAPLPEVARNFLVALPALVLPFIVRASVVEGVATATEVSTVGIVYSFIVGVVFYRQLEWRRIYPTLVDTASLSGAILIIIGVANSMSWALAQSGFAHDLVAAVSALPGGQAAFLAVSIVLFVVLGSILEGVPAVIVFGPLLFPVARALGVHEVHYAMVVILAMGVGLFAPPFGIGFYVASAISRVSPELAMPRLWAYLLILLLGVIVIAAVPWFSTGFL